ncbi:inositol monophosphatase [Lelliottia jeotgali]|nr:inositol monophosphatase [Lelliottia jeotgali]
MSACRQCIQLINDSLPMILMLRNNKKIKDDDSFVSEGDLLIQDILIKHLERILPNHKLISEELAPFADNVWDQRGSYIVIDPIDGTENFVSGLKEWGVGISIYTNGIHTESCIYLPELNEQLVSGDNLTRYESRIYGLSSSLTKDDLLKTPTGFEYRIIGCSMYNMLNAVKGAFARFDNVNGVNCWDVLPGLNLALEHNIPAYVDGAKYTGELLFPTKKYKISIGVACE